MDYEKLHKDTINKLQQMVNSGKITVETARGICADFVPESEDEKIRKHLITLFINDYGKNSNARFAGIKVKDIISWLEKQGEQKPVDKAEPKFKAGDWVVCNNGPHHIFQVIERSWPNAKYRNINGIEILLNVNTLDKQYHLWTIQDAKDGDVLAYNDGSLTIFHYRLSGLDAGLYMSHILLADRIEFKQTCAISNVHPATKEQRDLLFQKMHEAGYEWDAEKKELKKLEQKPIACSDGTIDNSLEGIIDAAIYWGKEAPTENGRIPEDKMKGAVDYYCSLIRNNDGWSEEDNDILNRCISLMSYNDAAKEETDWLKSFKERYIWKPSDGGDRE